MYKCKLYTIKRHFCVHYFNVKDYFYSLLFSVSMRLLFLTSDVMVGKACSSRVLNIELSTPVNSFAGCEAGSGLPGIRNTVNKNMIEPVN